MDPKDERFVRMLSALMLNDAADFLGCGKYDRGAITQHARGHDGRFPAWRTEVAYIGLETEIGLPESGNLPVCLGYEITVAAEADRSNLPLGANLLQIL